MAVSDIIRGAVAHGLIYDAKGREEGWIRQRLAEHRHPGMPLLQRRSDGRWLQISERRTETGGTVAVYSDLTEVKDSEQRAAAANQLILQSLRYASRIQAAVLPARRELDEVAADHFLIWEPRDIVGGDFFWFQPINDGYAVMVGDCTGHGVPGAFMTLIAWGLLDRMLRSADADNPSQVLTGLHRGVQSLLGQNEEEGATDDGLEAGICFINPKQRKMTFAGYYKIPAAQGEQENCVAHNGSLIPVPGRDIMVQAFYQGGVTVFDFTNSARIQEIAYFDRGPIDANQLVIGGYWSVYYYNGFLYGSEIARGLDIFELTPSAYLSQNEIDAAKLATREGCGASNDLNVQCQPHYVWPASFVVARAYLDQLTRDKSLPQDRADALNAAMKQVEDSSGSARNAARNRLESLAAELTKDAATAPVIAAKRMRDCVAVIQKRNAELK